MSSGFVCFVISLVLLVSANSVLSKTTENARTSEELTCGKMYSFLESRNITAVPAKSADGKGTTCSGRCCSAETEGLLRAAGRRDLEALLRHHARSLHGLLATTASSLHDRVIELARQSENKTLYLFAQVYQRMSILSKEPITRLYTDIRNYVNNTSDYSSTSDLIIETSVSDFFTDLFPLVYHHAINPQQKDFSDYYKTCLRNTFKEIQPFGDIPRQISQQVSKSLKAVQVLLRALALGSEVLNTTDTLLTEEAEKIDTSQSACHTALLKMSYCPKCLGLDTQIKPCSGYCLNVLRGCLSQHVSELNLPWHRFVSGVERLVIAVKTQDYGSGVSVDSVIKGLDTRISEAIMHAMENAPNLEKKVKRSCGHAKMSQSEPPIVAGEAGGSSRQQRPRPARGPALPASPTDSSLSHFRTAMARSMGFFQNLADTLCRDDSFAEQLDGAECWNGERVGEYTKTVVGSSASFQKYNPEVEIPAVTASQVSQIADSRVAKLSDQLGHMTEMVLSQLSIAYPMSEKYMQGDEAGSVDGSGSGRPDDSFTDDEVDYDGSQWNEGSGSGNGDITDNNDLNTVQIVNNRTLGENAVGAASSQSISSTIMFVTSIFILRFCA